MSLKSRPCSCPRWTMAGHPPTVCLQARVTDLNSSLARPVHASEGTAAAPPPWPLDHHPSTEPVIGSFCNFMVPRAPRVFAPIKIIGGDSTLIERRRRRRRLGSNETIRWIPELNRAYSNQSTCILKTFLRYISVLFCSKNSSWNYIDEIFNLEWIRFFSCIFSVGNSQG